MRLLALFLTHVFCCTSHAVLVAKSGTFTGIRAIQINYTLGDMGGASFRSMSMSGPFTANYIGTLDLETGDLNITSIDWVFDAITDTRVFPDLVTIAPPGSCTLISCTPPITGDITVTFATPEISIATSHATTIESITESAADFSDHILPPIMDFNGTWNISGPVESKSGTWNRPARQQPVVEEIALGRDVPGGTVDEWSLLRSQNISYGDPPADYVEETGSVDGISYSITTVSAVPEPHQWILIAVLAGAFTAKKAFDAMKQAI